MALDYVSLTVDMFRGDGGFSNGGTADFAPTEQLTDTVNHQIITEAAIPAALKSTGSPVVKLLATDNPTVLPSGWAWTVTFSGVSGSPSSWQFFLPYSGGAAQNLSDLAVLPAGTTALLTESAQALLAEG